MIVAVSMRFAPSATYPELRDGISHDWVRRLDSLDLTPVFVPNVLSDPAGYLAEIRAAGLILTGGDDIGRLPGEPDTISAWSDRDETETTLLGAALEAGTPVLAVCRGLQIANVYFGGRLVRDLHGLGDHVAVTHPVEIVDAPVRDFGGTGSIVTNSYHDHAVVVDGLAEELEPFALAAHGVVEGAFHRSLPLLAIQWHPERDNPAAEADRLLIGDWLARCA